MGTRDRGPGARHQEPGARVQEPGTRSQEAGNGNQEPGARHQGPGTRNQEPRAQGWVASEIHVKYRGSPFPHDPKGIVSKMECKKWGSDHPILKARRAPTSSSKCKQKKRGQVDIKTRRIGAITYCPQLVPAPSATAPCARALCLRLVSELRVGLQVKYM